MILKAGKPISFMPEISASVLNADFSKWEKWLAELGKAGVDRLHWDIMDNKYVPNAGVKIEQMQELRGKTKIFFETHIMAFKPENYLEEISEAGSGLAIFHIEATEKPLEIIELIESSGMKAGIAINNKTPAEKVFPFLPNVDLCLVMSVDAGFGGQGFNPKAIEKIRALGGKIDEEGFGCSIEVDGGINAQTGKKCIAAGADVLAAGTFIFSHPKGIARAVEELREID